MKLDQQRAAVELDRGGELLTLRIERAILGAGGRTHGQFLPALQDLQGRVVFVGDQRASAPARKCKS
jgi:hypothetical protein